MNLDHKWRQLQIHDQDVFFVLHHFEYLECRVNWIVLQVHLYQQIEALHWFETLHLIVTRDKSFEATDIFETLQAFHPIVGNLERRQITQRAHHTHVKFLKAVVADVEDFKCLRQGPHFPDLVTREIQLLEEGQVDELWHFRLE